MSDSDSRATEPSSAQQLAVPLGIRVRLRCRLLAPGNHNLKVCLGRESTIFSCVVVDAVHDDFVPHVRDAIGVGSFYAPGLSVSRSEMLNPDFINALTAVNSHFRQPRVTKLNRRFTRVNPSNLSLALLRHVVSRWIRHYPLAMTPRDYSRRIFGWEQSLALDWRISSHSKRATSESHEHICIVVNP